MATKRKINVLKKYLAEHEMSYATFSYKVGCSAASVCLWVNYKAVPSPVMAAKIQKVTKGNIPVTCWGYVISPKGRLIKL